MGLTHRCHCDGLTKHCLAAKLLGIIKFCSACVLIKLNERLPFGSCLESSFCLMPSVSLFMPKCMRLKVQSLSYNPLQLCEESAMLSSEKQLQQHQLQQLQQHQNLQQQPEQEHGAASIPAVPIASSPVSWRTSSWPWTDTKEYRT